jgi:hypothetical protein
MATFTTCNNDDTILHGKWDLYYHLPNDKQWDIHSYKTISKNIQTVDTLIPINESLTEDIIKYCMLFVMRSGITPMWEDIHNRTGGCFSFKVINKHVHEVWKTLFYALCGESLCIDKAHSRFVNGITISPKKSFCIVKIWLKDYSLQDPNIIIPIENLSKQGCLFKKHAPEF